MFIVCIFRETDCFWFEPLPVHGLQTRPGLFTDPASPTPTDTVVRYSVDYVSQITRRGSFFTSPGQLEAYLEKPKKECWEVPDVAFRFPLSSSSSPTFSRISGNRQTDLPLAATGQSGKRVYTRDKREGISMSKLRGKPNVSNAPGKYCVNPHPYFELSEEALPEGTPANLVVKAKETFSCSLTRGTQSNYATAVNHLRKAEVALGRLKDSFIEVLAPEWYKWGIIHFLGGVPWVPSVGGSARSKSHGFIFVLRLVLCK